MIKDLPVLICSLKLTLLPGEFSTKTSTLGILSPTLMKARAELWKNLDDREALSANLRRAVVDAIVMMFQLERDEGSGGCSIASCACRLNAIGRLASI